MKKSDEQIDFEEKLHTYEKRIAELEALVKHYEDQVRLLTHRRFGKSSEKTIDERQLTIFNEPEEIKDEKLPEPTVEEITYKREKRTGKREDDLSKLPTETIDYELSEEEKVCPECGEELHEMSKDVRRELVIIPAQVKVVEHVQHIYACRNCEKTSTSVPVVKASAPEPVIKSSLASPSAVAHIMIQKYVNAVPLYRQEQDFLRNEIALSRQTMANWIIQCAENWLTGIYLALKKALLSEQVLHADETVLQVLSEPGKKANTNSYEWLYRTSGCAEHPIVLYEYQPTRSSAHPKEFLKGFGGYLHTDGYAGYHSLPDITVVGCWAHVRRKFDEALKSVSEDKRSGSEAEKGLIYCNRLFGLERVFSELSFEERFQKRKEQSKPVSDAFFAWANSVNTLPKSALGKAIHYALSQKQYLENIYLDGRLELSNNRAERSIKPFVIGRKNWLFSNSQKGANASSAVYSLIETAKENGIKPFEYLRFLLEKLPNAKSSQLEDFLPWGELAQGCAVARD